MKKISILFLTLLCIITISGCGKKDNKDTKCCECKDAKQFDVCCDCDNPYLNNNLTQVESKPALVISNNEKIYLLNDNFKIVWNYKISGEQAKYNCIRIDGEYLYFTDGEKLYKKYLNSDKIEDLNVNLPNYWYFNISGDNLIYSNVDKIHYINLKNKNDLNINIESNNTDTIIKNNIYYTDKNTENLNYYNIDTNEVTKLFDSARIEEYDKDSLLIINENNDIILYNTNDNISNVLFNEEYSYISGLNYPIHLYNNKVYLIRENKLENIIDKEILYTYNLKENEIIKDFLMLDKDKFVLKIFVIDKSVVCEDDICDPVGETKYILINNKKEQGIDDNIDILNDDFEFEYIY